MQTHAVQLVVEEGVAIDTPDDASASDVRPPDVSSATSPKGRPLREALTTIERAASSIRIVPVLMVVGALWWGQAVLIPLLVGVLISYALEPPVAQLETWRIPRAVGAPLLLGALAVGIGGTIYMLRGEAVAFGNRIPDAAHKVAAAINGTRSDTPWPVAKLQQAASELENAAATNRQPRAKDDVTPVRVEEPTFKWRDWLWQGSHGALDVGGQLIVIVFLVYYLLVAGDMYKRKLVHIVGPSMSDKKMTVHILAEIDRQIAQFLWSRIMISGTVGAAIWMAFRLLGLEEAGIWGVLSAFLFTVPFVGPALVFVGAGIAGFVQFGTAGMAGAAAGSVAAIAAIEGNVLTPLLMSRVGEMNPAAVFVSLLFWGWIWGIWGLLLAVPITAAIKSVCERVEDLRAFAELLKA